MPIEIPNSLVWLKETAGIPCSYSNSERNGKKFRKCKRLSSICQQLGKLTAVSSNRCYSAAGGCPLNCIPLLSTSCDKKDDRSARSCVTEINELSQGCRKVAGVNDVFTRYHECFVKFRFKTYLSMHPSFKYSDCVDRLPHT